MIVSPYKYYRKIFPECVKETRYLPEEFYNLITTNKTLQKRIDQEVIDEFFADESNIKLYIEEIFWAGTSPDINYDFIDADYHNIIYDTIGMVYNQRFIYGRHGKTFCELTRK